MSTANTCDDEIIYSFNGRLYAKAAGECERENAIVPAGKDNPSFRDCTVCLTSYPAYMDGKSFSENHTGAVYTVEGRVSIIRIVGPINPTYGRFAVRTLITPETQIVIVCGDDTREHSCASALSLIASAMNTTNAELRSRTLKLVLRSVFICRYSATLLSRIVRTGVLWSFLVLRCNFGLEMQDSPAYNGLGLTLSELRVDTFVEQADGASSTGRTSTCEALRPSTLRLTGRNYSSARFPHVQALECDWNHSFPPHASQLEVLTHKTPERLIFKFGELPRRDLSSYIDFLHRQVSWPYIEFNTTSEKPARRPYRYPSEWITEYVAQPRLVGVWQKEKKKAVIWKRRASYALFAKCTARASMQTGVPIEIVNRTMSSSLDNPWNYIEMMNPIGGTMATAHMRGDKDLAIVDRLRHATERYVVSSLASKWTPRSPSSEMRFLPVAVTCAHYAYIDANDGHPEAKAFTDMVFDFDSKLFDLVIQENLFKRQLISMAIPVKYTALCPKKGKRWEAFPRKESLDAIVAKIADFADFRISDLAVPGKHANTVVDGLQPEAPTCDKDVIDLAIRKALAGTAKDFFDSAKRANVKVGIVPGLLNVREHNAAKKEQEKKAIRDAQAALFEEDSYALETVNTSDEDQSVISASAAYDHPNQEDYMNALAASPEKKPPKKRRRSLKN